MVSWGAHRSILVAHCSHLGNFAVPAWDWLLLGPAVHCPPLLQGAAARPGDLQCGSTAATLGMVSGPAAAIRGSASYFYPNKPHCESLSNSPRKPASHSHPSTKDFLKKSWADTTSQATRGAGDSDWGLQNEGPGAVTKTKAGRGWDSLLPRCKRESLDTLTSLPRWRKGLRH